MGGFDLLDSNDFYVMKSLLVGDFEAEIKIYFFNRWVSHFVSLPHAQCTLTIGSRMRGTVYAYKAQNIWRFLIVHGAYAKGMLTIPYRMRRVCLQFATACAGYAYNSLPHAQGTLTICYRMRRVRLQFVTACAGYAYNLLPHA